jgi:hypothetical protein
LLLLAGVGDALDHRRPSQSDAVEEAQCRNRDIEGGPRRTRFNEVDLVGPHLHQPQPVGRLLEVLSEFSDRMYVAALCYR